MNLKLNNDVKDSTSVDKAPESHEVKVIDLNLCKTINL